MTQNVFLFGNWKKQNKKCFWNLYFNSKNRRTNSDDLGTVVCNSKLVNYDNVKIGTKQLSSFLLSQLINVTHSFLC